MECMETAHDLVQAVEPDQGLRVLYPNEGPPCWPAGRMMVMGGCTTLALDGVVKMCALVRHCAAVVRLACPATTKSSGGWQAPRDA